MKPQLGGRGVPRELAFPFGGAPSHCLGISSASPAPGSASSPALQETMGQSRTPVCWTQAVSGRAVRERACPSTSAPRTLMMTLMAGWRDAWAGGFSFVPGRSRQPLGPLLPCIGQWPA